MSAQRKLVFVANTRLPSERAQGLQVLHSACATARAGWDVEVVHARRRKQISLPVGTDLFAHSGVRAGARPKLTPVGCIDWVDSVPRSLQFWPARLQEWSFSRSAAQHILTSARESWVLSREIECAHALARAGHPALFLEVHSVPGGSLRRKWLSSAMQRARGVLAISGGVRDDLLALGVEPRKLLVAHDGFEPSLFEPRIARESARAELGLARDARVVVYTGGLLAWKGVDVLLEAARTMSDTMFVIAGGMAADVARLREHAKGLANVRIEGFQPAHRVPLYLAAADVAVAPNRSSPDISSRYTSPLKVFEAMAAGVTLIASDLPSMRELLTHGKDAWLVPSDRPDELAAGLKKVLGDESLRVRLAQALSARAPAHTWDARAARILGWMGERTA